LILLLRNRNARCQGVQTISTPALEMDPDPTLATVPIMNFLVLLATAPVSIPFVLPSTPKPQSPPTMRKVIQDSLGTPTVNPIWTTEGDMIQSASGHVLSILVLVVLTPDFLLGIQHS